MVRNPFEVRVQSESQRFDYLPNGLLKEIAYITVNSVRLKVKGATIFSLNKHTVHKGLEKASSTMYDGEDNKNRTSRRSC